MLLTQARGLLAAADAAQTPLRLLGGMGIRALLGERMNPRFLREIGDIDFITTRKASRAVEQLFAEQGFEAERSFNALNGARRLLFYAPAGAAKVDVFVESFQMCHELPLAERLQVRPETLPAAELMMTKLQIVSLNPKDRDDLYALLSALEVGSGDVDEAGRDAIDATRIASLAAADWGLHHSFELNIARLHDGVNDAGLPAELAAGVQRRLQALTDALEREPKTRAWKLRAKVGERKRWYEEPEEVDR